MFNIRRVIATSAATAVMAGTVMTGLVAAPAFAADATANAAASSSSGKGCDRKVRLGSSRYKGDIFHSYASTVGVEHGHTGIYYTRSTIVEAPGGSARSRSRAASTHNVCAKAYKMYVRASQNTRNKAANYAFNRFRGKAYDSAFWKNKNSSDSKLNCSELVWKAYKRNGIELDYNGGPGVYPNDIKKDGSTVVYATRG